VRECTGSISCQIRKLVKSVKKGQDDVRLWDLSIGLLKEKVGTLDYGFRR